jgi:hypothetical protein
MFTVGRTYTCRSIGDHNCIWSFVVTSRTEKSVVIFGNGEVKRCKIHDEGEGEFIFPLGRYAMAPVLRA